MFNTNKMFTCSKHNYTGLNSPCPDCKDGKSRPAEGLQSADLATEVKNDIEQRIQKGIATYGERLKTNNGRIALQDAYEEILDLALYIKQELKERESNFGTPKNGN